MLADVFDRLVPNRTSQYLHRVEVVQHSPTATRPHSYHAGDEHPDATAAARRTGGDDGGHTLSTFLANGIRLVNKLLPTRDDNYADAAVRRSAVYAGPDGKFSDVSHTWRFKRPRTLR